MTWSRRAQIAGGALLAAGIAVAIVLVVRSGRSPGNGSALPSPPVGVDAARQELLTLLTRGRRLTFHARYVAAGATAGLPDSIEVWRKAGRVRADTQTRSGGTVTYTAAFQGSGAPKACTRHGTGTWSCRAAATAGGPGDLVDQLGADLADGQILAGDATVRRRAVRCFTETAGSPRRRVCVSNEGIVALIDGGSGRLELDALDRTVPDAVFTPPA